MQINGGAVVAMIGKDCVAIASDKRLGLQALTVSKDFEKVFHVGEQLLIGWAGLATDIQSVQAKLSSNLNILRLREEREISCRQYAHMVSSFLYSKRFGPFYCEPVVAGLERNPTTGSYHPFICSMDVIGCINWAKDFVVAGTASDSLYGMCECLYEENLVYKDDLFLEPRGAFRGDFSSPCECL
jgi:20S proteasome subunit beta 3